MTDKLHQDADNTPKPPRVTSDYGGRRKVFERRLAITPFDHPDRRSGLERRSGFDRRSTCNSMGEREGELRTADTEEPSE